MKSDKKSSAENNSIRRRIADKIDMSKEIILDTAMIRVSGNNQLVLENYKGILEYGDRCIRIKINPKAVKIVGNRLEIKIITDEVLYIIGEIAGIMFTEE